VADDESRTDAFFALSAALTGFDRFALHGTGMGALYLKTASERGGEAFAKLLAEWARLEPAESAFDRDAAIEQRLMLSPEWGGAARQLIICGTRAAGTTHNSSPRCSMRTPMSKG
jgi:hypothetical protein